jgi:hypothetical protein
VHRYVVMNNPDKNQEKDPKTSTEQLPEGQGESAGRRAGIESGGGQPLTTPLEDGQVREKDKVIESRH